MQKCGSLPANDYNARAMLTCVQANLSRHDMASRGDLVLVAVSGGADSVALLHALYRLRQRLGLRLAVGHLHHGIRGTAADADAAFVRRLARQLDLPFIEERQNVPQQARAAGVSLEMAARAARYDFLARGARQLGAAAVAIAHTADDQAETILLRLARGAGPQGLGGMEPVSWRDGLKIIRPLFSLRHADAVTFLKQNRLRWREDATNRDPHFLRNRIRHEILPLLEKRLNPQIRTALLRTADVLREENVWLDKLAADALKKCGAVGAPRRGGSGFAAGLRRNKPARPTLSAQKLATLPLPLRRRVLRLWLMHAGLTTERLNFEAVDTVLALLKSTRGTKTADLGDDRRVVRRYDQLALENTSATKPSTWQLLTQPHRGIIKERPTQPGQLPARATLNARVVDTSPLIVRPWRAGDRMAPLGMSGTKKLQDIFTDAKVPRELRHYIPVVECRGEIVWLPGYRVACGWEVPDSRSRSLLLTLRADHQSKGQATKKPKSTQT